MLRKLFCALLSLLNCSLLLADELAPVIHGPTVAADIFSTDHPQNVIGRTHDQPSAPYVQEACDLVSPSMWVATDLLVWQPHMRSLDYASTEDGTSLAIGDGETHRVGFERDSGFRIELGRMTKVGWGVSANYTNFEADGSGAVNRPAGVGQLFSTLGHPGGPEEADTATATTSLDYNTFDLALRMRAVDHRFRSVDLFGGLRWANINHELNAFFDGRDYVNGTIADRMEVEAFGLFFGGEGNWKMASGWSIFGRASMAGLYGEMQNTRTETNLNGFEQLVNFRDSYEEPIFNLDARVGLAKTISRVQVRAGYDISIWTGIGDRVRFSDDIEEAAFSAASGDLLLEGFFVQAAFNW